MQTAVVETPKGTLETQSGDLFEFIKKTFGDNNEHESTLPQFVFVSEILKDLSVLCKFLVDIRLFK